MADGYLADGMSLTTIGVGLEFDVNLMRGLAEHGAGNFYFLEDAAAVTEVFVDEIDYFTAPLATSVDFEVTPSADPDAVTAIAKVDDRMVVLLNLTGLFGLTALEVGSQAA